MGDIRYIIMIKQKQTAFNTFFGVKLYKTSIKLYD